MPPTHKMEANSFLFTLGFAACALVKQIHCYSKLRSKRYSEFAPAMDTLHHFWLTSFSPLRQATGKSCTVPRYPEAANTCRTPAPRCRRCGRRASRTACRGRIAALHPHRPSHHHLKDEKEQPGVDVYHSGDRSTWRRVSFGRKSGVPQISLTTDFFYT